MFWFLVNRQPFMLINGVRLLNKTVFSSIGAGFQNRITGPFNIYFR